MSEKTKVHSRRIEADEHGMRLDRWFKLHYPDLKFGNLQKLLRSGQVRIEGRRVKSDSRVETGQTVRIPPIEAFAPVVIEDKRPLTARTLREKQVDTVLHQMLLYEDDKVFVFNKPSGLAVQGGSGVTRHIDAMLEAWRNKKGEKPRLVHRIDRDTSGILVVARTRAAAQALTGSFRARETQKIYWSLVRGVPPKREGKISTWLIKESVADGKNTTPQDRMRVCPHGTKGADLAVSYYRLIEMAGRSVSWLEMQPHTGRTHQLRVHAAHIDHPILGDNKYFFCDQNWSLPGGIQNRLHLHAQRIIIPHPAGGLLDVTAPLPPHMRQSFNLLGFNEDEG